MHVHHLGRLSPTDGIYTIEAQFFTEQLVVCGELTSPDSRLSDHLNSQATSVEISLINAHRFGTSREIELAGTQGQITKAQLLFALPLSEPVRPAQNDNQAWRRTVSLRCWSSVGGFSIVGKYHTDAGREPKLILRSLGNDQFFPLTDATITFPDSASHDYPTVIVNRHHLELVALVP